MVHPNSVAVPRAALPPVALLAVRAREVVPGLAVAAQGCSRAKVAAVPMVARSPLRPCCPAQGKAERLLQAPEQGLLAELEMASIPTLQVLAVGLVSQPLLALVQGLGPQRAFLPSSLQHGDEHGGAERMKWPKHYTAMAQGSRSRSMTGRSACG